MGGEASAIYRGDEPLYTWLALPPEVPVSFVPMDAVGELGGLRLDAMRTLDEIGSGYTYFADGDVVVAKITPCFENGKGALAAGLTNGVAFGTTELHVLRPAPDFDPRFLFYLTVSERFRKLGEASMYGAGGQQRVPDTFIKDLLVPFPSLGEQCAIAAFLEDKTARIDTLIAKKRRLLELLAEKRQAVITRAVTKGLDSTALMKHTGIPWLGDVPAHWEVNWVKHLAERVVDCLHTTPRYDGELTYPAIRTSDLDRGRLFLDSAELVSEEVYQERVCRLTPEAGDVLYSREGERFGHAAVITSGVKCTAPGLASSG